MALPESGKLEFYAAWASNVGQAELSARLRESAVRVRRMERGLDELVDEAAEDERVTASRVGARERVTGASPSASAFSGIARAMPYDAALRDGSPDGR